LRYRVLRHPMYMGYDITSPKRNLLDEGIVRYFRMPRGHSAKPAAHFRHCSAKAAETSATSNIK
jgi:hypothetical protein